MPPRLQPLAFMEANHLGQIRTGAASGYATDLLAKPDADTLGIIGSGFQARTQWRRFVRFGRSRRFESGAAVRRSAADLRKNVPPPAVDSAEEAVRGAQIVVTATNAKDPVLESGWIAPGTLVNAMGSNAATRRELPEDLVCRADFIAVDSLEQAKIEAGDLILAGCWSNVVELQAVKRQWDPNGFRFSNHWE